MSLIILAVLGYLISPVLLICGWAQWVRHPKSRTVPSILSLVGIVLATISALLAIAAVAYAQVHRFPHSDPMLSKLYRTGVVFSGAESFLELEVFGDRVHCAGTRRLPLRRRSHSGC